MIVIQNAEGTVRTTGDHWDDELGLYLDLDASIQRWPFWWEDVPHDYYTLTEKREEKGIEVEDHLFYREDLDEPYHFGDDDDE